MNREPPVFDEMGVWYGSARAMAILEPFSCAKRAADPTNEFAACRRHCGNTDTCLLHRATDRLRAVPLSEQIAGLPVVERIKGEWADGWNECRAAVLRILAESEQDVDRARPAIAASGLPPERSDQMNHPQATEGEDREPVAWRRREQIRGAGLEWVYYEQRPQYLEVEPLYTRSKS